MYPNNNYLNNDIIINDLESIFYEYSQKNTIKVYQKVSFNKGENILKQGSFLSNQTILINGLVKIILEAENKKNYIFKLALPGEFIGLSALFNDETSPFSAICMCDSEVLLVKLDPFEKIFNENNALHDYIIKLRSNYFRLIYDRLTLQATRNSIGKLAHTILYITQLKALMPNIYEYIGRKDLADMAGVSLESVMKILNEFKGDKIINIKDKDIEVNRLELLERLVSIG